MAVISLENLSEREVLEHFAEVLEELRRRGVTRSSNNPVADYTERLVATRLNFQRVGNSTAGHDAVDTGGTRYEIKGRRLTRHNSSTQLSAIRNLNEKKFDFLVGVIYRENFAVDYAALVPHQVVVDLSSYVPHTNSHRFVLKRTVLQVPGVRDVTNELAA